jgi:hypothetical protein
LQSLPVTWCTTSLTINNCTLCPHCIYLSENKQRLVPHTP